MQHLEELVHTPDGLMIRCLRNVGPYENNIYVVADEASSEAYVIDAGYEPEEVAAAAAGLQVKQILITHGHRDHHENAGALRGLLNAPVGIPTLDREMLSVDPDFIIQDGDRFAFGPYELQAMHTPGHTPGSTCFLLRENLFSGDTLFLGGPGNTRKDPEKFAQIIDSIKTRLFILPAETLVRPGHGRDTVLSAEMPHLEDWITRGW